jgi:hypothetical protein
MEEQDLDFDIVFNNPKGKAKKIAPPVEEDFDFDIVQSSAPIKKKNPLATGGPSIQAKPKSSLGLGGQVITGPSVSMPKQPKTVEGQQQVSALDDLWNTFKGSGLNTLANIAKVPEMAQTYALDLVTTAMGMNDEFNRLPAVAKKEIRNAVNSTSKVSPLPNVQLSNQAADYLNKRSEEVYQKTRKEEGDIVDEITNFTKNPSVEGVGNILYRGLKSTVESVPFMAGYALSPALVGVAAASGKRAEDLEKTGGNLGVNYLLNSTITGGSEVFAQGVTNKIMGRAAKAAIGNKELSEIVSKGYKKTILRDMLEEFGAESLTKGTQDISDAVFNGRDIDWWDVGRQTLNAGITGAVSAGTIRSGGEIIGGARNYLATQIMPKSDKDKINNNIKTISELNTQKGDDINPEVNSVIDNKIKDLEAQNTSMVSVAQSAVDNLTDDQIKQVVSIDDQLYENYNKAKAIFDDESMDQDAKDLLLKDLLEKKNQLNEQKDAIQKQATSQVPIQPEAGAGVQVAQGEPQAESQVPTQEGQRQEVVDIEKRRQEELNSLPLVPISFDEELSDRQKEHLKKQDEINAKYDAEIDALPPQVPAEEVKVEEVASVAEEPIVEQPIAEEPVTEEAPKEQPTSLSQGQKSAVQEGINRALDMVKRYPKQDDILTKYKALKDFKKTNQEYIDANQSQKDGMIRQMNIELNLAPNVKAPGVEKLGLKPKPQMATVNTKTVLNERIKEIDQSIKEGQRNFKQAVTDVANEIKVMLPKGVFSTAQVKVVTNALASNLLNPRLRESALNRVSRLADNVEYAQSLLTAKKLKGKIRKTLKSGKEIGDVEKSIRNFLKIDPNLIDDINQYTNRANEIFNAVRNVRVENGEVIGKIPVVLADIDAYASEQNAIQEEISKNSLLDKYNDLVESGLISGDMSLDEIKRYIASVEENPSNAESSKSDKVREYTKAAFADLSETVKQMLEDGEVNREDVDFKMIKDFTDMDIEALPLEKQLYAVESLDNFIVNGVTSRMGAIYRSYIGVENSDTDAASGMEARPLSYGIIGRLAYLKNVTDKAVIGNILSGIASIGDLYNNLEAVYISKTDSLISGLFRSTTKGVRFLKNSGFSGIVRGFVQGKKIANDFAKKYSEKYDKTKPNNIDFKSASNVYERGIFADLSRTILNGTPEQVKVEFDRKMKQLTMTIDTLRATKKKDSVAKANMYDSVYQKIKDAENIDEVKQYIDPINQEAVKDIQDMWKKYYPEFKQMAADYYNVILDEDANYAPDMYEKLVMDTADDLLVKGTFKMAFDVVSTEESGTLKKNQKIDGLPKDKNNEINRVRDYDFDYNNISALEKTLVDVRTTPFVQQFMGYTNSAAYKEIFPDFDDRQMVTKRLNFNVNALRERQDTYSSKEAKMFNKFTTALSRYGTRIGLGSLSSAPKQSIPMVTNTAINMIGDLESFGMSFKDIFDKDAISFLDNSGYGISLRGSEAQTSIDYAEKLVDRANQGKVGNISEGLSKLGDKYIELFLKNPDVFVANMAWLGYYRSKLKSMGVDMSTFDWANHELNEEAADYAEFMVQDQQNMNVAELGGKLLASKDASTKIIRQLLFPFASYQFNLKDKNNRNITIMTSKTSSQSDKVKAAQSFASGMLEAYTFQTIQSLIGGMLLAAAYAAIGYDEPEDEKTDGILDAIGKAMPFVRSTSTREKWNDELFVGKSIFEFIAPIPNQLEYVTLLGLNQAMDYIQGGNPKEQLKKSKEEEAELDIFGNPLKKKRGPKKTEEEKKKAKTDEQLNKPFRFFAKEELPYGQVFSDMIGGVPSVGYEAIAALANSANEAFAGSYTDKYGNEYTYSDEQKKILKQSLIPKAMVAMNIAPREFLTIGNNIEKAVKAKAKEDSKAAKAKAKPGKVLF